MNGNFSIRTKILFISNKNCIFANEIKTKYSFGHSNIKLVDN